MKTPLQILHLEDEPSDAELIKATLEADGIRCAITHAQNQDDFMAALERGGMDLILSDFSLPAFDGVSALKAAHAQRPNIPLIFVSGTLGEERAIESLKNGATDFVMKENLARLAPAVRRAMREIEAQTDRRTLEANFIEAQKMEVVGQLAGGVAHDFNNLIAIVMGYSELIMQKLGPNNAVKNDLEAIQMAAGRAAGLTRQLLIFSRKQTVQPVVLDLGEVVHSMEQMLRRLIDENIELTFIHDKEAGRVKADPGYVGQVLMNLVVNARDAMPSGGKLSVKTINVTLEESDERLHKGVPPGEYVMLSVSDTGVGMTEEVKGRLFEAFFTTKPKGKGTGLGLVTCQTIVQQSGGHMIVSSAVGKGTTFKVYFPRVDLPLDVAANALQNGVLPRGVETLLVVEDDPAVRLLARSVLEAQGYEVLTAANGQEGLRVVREHTGALICLVVTDVIMPLMGGKEMAGRLKTIHPDLKILYTSGYTDDAIAHHGVLDPGLAFLPKPYTPTMLTRKVREMVDSEAEQQP